MFCLWLVALGLVFNTCVNCCFGFRFVWCCLEFVFGQVYCIM